MVIAQKNGLPLKSIREIPDKVIELLGTLSITTCEEFISSVHSDPDAYAKFLQITKESLIEIYNIVRKKLPSKIIEELEAPGEKHAYGALPPYNDYETLKRLKEEQEAGE